MAKTEELIARLRKRQPTLDRIIISIASSEHDEETWVEIDYQEGEDISTRCSKSAYYGETREILDQLEEQLLS